MHLEWDEREQRAELRFLIDQPSAGVDDALTVQPVHLTGHTVQEALSATWSTTGMRANALSGSAAIPVTGPGTDFDKMVRQQAAHLGPLVALADFMASSAAQFVDARVVLGRGEPHHWPPEAGEHAMRLWLMAASSGGA